MSSFLSEIGGITAGVGAEGLAFAAGFAASHALQPEATLIGQDAWNAAQLRRLDAMLAAQAAAEGLATETDMATEASYSGYDSTRFAYMYGVSLTAPGMGELLNMLRRGTINSGNFTHGLRKSKLEPMWDTALTDLANVYIGIGDIATAIVRGAVPAPSWVPVAPPTTTDHVPRFPVTEIDPVALAAKLGYSEDMLRIMTARSGLSLAPILATQAFFRGALTQNDWLLAIAEGDLRTEWAETLKAAARAIPSPLDYTEAHLRGWISQQAMYDGAARHGVVPADTQLMYEVRRRPLTVPTITKALARGGTFDATQAPFSDPYVASVHEANLGPEWYSLAEAMKYTYPSAFVLRQLLKDGTLTAQEASQIFQYEGWEPALADKVAAAYAPAGATVSDPHVTKAQTQLWATTHRSYVAEETDDQQATVALEAAGVTTAAVPEILTLWGHERTLVRKQLTPAQVKKAWGEAVVNPATGAAWSRDDALAALIARGYSTNDAATFLEV